MLKWVIKAIKLPSKWNSHKQNTKSHLKELFHDYTAKLLMVHKVVLLIMSWVEERPASKNVFPPQRSAF